MTTKKLIIMDGWTNGPTDLTWQVKKLRAREGNKPKRPRDTYRYNVDTISIRYRFNINTIQYPEYPKIPKYTQK